jgi:uncharacterized protein (TIGR03437 family)
MLFAVLVAFGSSEAIAQSAPTFTGAVTAAAGGCPALPAAQSSFQATDSQVWFDFTYTGGVTGDNWSVAWFEPNGSLYLTETFTQNGTGGGWCWNWFISIAGYPPGSTPGAWSVSAVRNGQTLVTNNFTISPSGAVSTSVVTTVAGGGWRPFPSQILAAYAPLGSPRDPAVDSMGNLYVADSYNNVVVKITPGGTLTLVAGNGNPGFAGDGGPATSASLNTPQGLAVDSAGNLYIADYNNHRIRKVSGGTITTVAGNGIAGFSGDGGAATSASFNHPLGVGVDTAGNIYVADQFNARIREISGGKITTVAGGGSVLGDGGLATLGSLNNPYDVVADNNGNLYIADYGDNRIRKVFAGIMTTVAGTGIGGFSGDGGAATQAQLSGPSGVAVDSAGNLYIADYGYNHVRKVSNGFISTVAGSGASGYAGDGGSAVSASLDGPVGVAVDASGRIFISDFYNERIRLVTNGIITTFAGAGGGTYFGDGGPAVGAGMLITTGVAVDSTGNIFIADRGNNLIRKVSKGTITTVAGSGAAGFSGDGGAATSAKINTPTSVAVDGAGNIYFTDYLNNRVRMVAPNSAITTFAGSGSSGFFGDGGPAYAASLSFPQGIAVDSAGNVYIADTYNNRIRKVTGGTITTVAGNGNYGYSGDGGPATNAALADPFGVTVDSAGNIYIADTSNNRIRKVSNGIITTIAGGGSVFGDGGPATSAYLSSPQAVAVDAAGHILIADTLNNRIRKVSGGIITTLAGIGAASFGGDGSLATLASFANPYGVAVDAAGNVYIADTFNYRIREVLNQLPTYQVTSASSPLTFSATAGGGAPAAQTINLASSTPGLVFTASASAPWLTISPFSGTIPSVLQVSVDPSTLAAGTYQGTITITAPNAVPPTTTVAVTVTVTTASPAGLSISTQNVNFSATQGSSALTQQLQIANIGGGSLSFTAAASGASWLSISATTGTATASAPASLTITATPGSLAPGTYSGTVAITGVGSTKNIPVTLSLSAPTAVILISQVGLSFTAVAQGGVPLPQTFGILNTGQGSMNWTAASTTLTGGGWLQISPSSGTVQNPYLDVSLVTVSINTSGLGAGTYYGKIQVSATAVNAPQSVTVILTVLPPGFSPGPQIYPTGVIFTGVAGATPGSQDVQVGNPTGQVNNFQSGQIGMGFSFLPPNGSIQSNQPTIVRVSPNFSQLTPGNISRGTITLQFSDGSPSQTVNILMVVAPTGATAGFVGEGDARWYHIDLTSAASGCASQILQVVYRSPMQSFAAVQGQATPLEVQVTDGCGNLVGPGGGQSATVTANFSDSEPAQTMTHIGNGIWQVGWKPVKTGSVVVSVLALLPAGGTGVVGGSATLSGTVSAPSSTGSTPLVTAAGVVHSASGQGGVPIAPGGLITVYGNNLADGVAQDSGLPLPQTLSGTQVLLGNQPLPILYTNTGQLNVQVPYGVPINTQSQLTVQHGSTLSLPQSLVVAPAQPGIFTVNQTGKGQGSIVKSDGVTLVEPGTPATAGDTIVIYCTGLGAVTPAVKEGSPAPSTPPLSTTVNTVTVTIGGQQAAVAFSGLAPGFAGLYQINVVVPSGITPGNAVPVVLTIAGQTSPPVTIAIH